MNPPDAPTPIARHPNDWRPWFAWRPVKIKGRWHWLCWLEIRQRYADYVHEVRVPPRAG